MIRTAEAHWTGDLKNGQGRVALGSGVFAGPYSFASRFEDGEATNPEELLGAAHAGCFSMALALACSTAGHIPTNIDTTAHVHLTKGEGGMTISKIALSTRGQVPGMSAAEFTALAESTKAGCIVSRALSAVPMELQVEFIAG